MSFLDILKTKFGKKPVTLYEFKIGATVAYMTTKTGGYTTPAGKPAADFVAQTTWASAPIKQGQIKQTGNLLEASVDVSLPNSNPFAQQIIGNTGFDIGSVRIWHAYENDPDLEFVSSFDGRIVSIKPDLDWIAITLENDETISRRQGLEAIIQRPCRHVIYDLGTGCPVILANFQTPATVTAISGRSMTVTEAGTAIPGFYNNGRISFNGATRMIKSHNGTTLVTMGDMPGLADEVTLNGTAAVQIARGCRNIVSDCIEFGAFLDFGGFEHMARSPFDGTSIE